MASLLVTGQWVVDIPPAFEGKEQEYVKLVQQWLKEDPIGFLSSLHVTEERFPVSQTVSVLKYEWNRSANDSLQ